MLPIRAGWLMACSRIKARTGLTPYAHTHPPHPHRHVSSSLTDPWSQRCERDDERCGRDEGELLGNITMHRLPDKVAYLSSRSAQRRWWTTTPPAPPHRRASCFICRCAVGYYNLSSTSRRPPSPRCYREDIGRGRRWRKRSKERERMIQGPRSIFFKRKKYVCLGYDVDVSWSHPNKHSRELFSIGFKLCLTLYSLFFNLYFLIFYAHIHRSTHN